MNARWAALRLPRHAGAALRTAARTSASGVRSALTITRKRISTNQSALNALVENFSEAHPEFELEMVSQKTNGENANILGTEQVYASEKRVSDSVTEGLEYSVTYYDNGYFMIGESSYTRTEN